jgi:hypothetical protein
MRIMITGARGLLGAAIAREFQADADVHAFDREHLDVSNETAVTGAVAAVYPDVLVNCAAYNDVDGAEQEPDAALRVNAFGVLALARAARSASATLVHYSTDFVFDGETDRPYTEEDRRTRAACTRHRNCWATGSRTTRRARMCFESKACSASPLPAGGREAASRRLSIASAAAPRCRSSSIGPCRRPTPPISPRRRAR